ncbi:alpha-methylacyl-CoA racemase [Sinobacterium caligoides]|uniref:Alpha-methylacyl-CoA racemase n=1 Tax=Sinobacterium caligoides TaxID=933926 RepID=A0A3N2E055_9GAMM|nr:CaiB/BaiF CoA-transferase family protein [Sinobacterium caligoides]ROS04955.1 alpha-methylacyl-CoA racemase [Sinobacterium caligoides]
MGPLSGFRIIEMAGIGPGPFAGMLLSDMGAEVIRIDRTSANMMSMGANPADICARGRQSIAVNLKDPEGIETVLRLVETADAIFEGFRPGVMEKLGLGPDVCAARNEKIVYGRMTGWGQTGPLSKAAGHDINYIAITGALDAIGTAESGPVAPLNLVGDFGGGSMYLVTGMLAALLEASRSGKGQVVDAAITDGVISLMSTMAGFQAMGIWDNERENNILDGGAHYYDTYECSDGRWVSVGSIEPQFYALLAKLLEVDLGEPGFETQFDKASWPKYKQRIADKFKTKTQAQWCEVMEGTDVCFAPVLNQSEASSHPHNVSRQSHIDIEGIKQSAPAPRFSRTVSEVQGPAVAAGENTDELLQGLGLDAEQIGKLRAAGIVS